MLRWRTLVAGGLACVLLVASGHVRAEAPRRPGAAGKKSPAQRAPGKAAPAKGKVDPSKVDPSKKAEQEDAVAKEQKEDEGSLARVPAKAAKGFAASAVEFRVDADQAIAHVTQHLKELGSWNIDPAQKAQVASAVRRLENEQKELERAGELYRRSVAHEILSHRLAIRAAHVQELVDGAKTDVSEHAARLHDLGLGTLQKADENRVKAMQFLASALIQYIKGDLAQAIVLTKQSITTDEEIALAHAFQGSFYYLTQNTAQAVESWKRALKLDPRNEAVRQALGAVQHGAE